MTGEWQVSIYMKLKAGRSLTCTSNDTESAGYQPTKGDEEGLATSSGRRSHLGRSKEPPRVVEGATSSGRRSHLGWLKEPPRVVAGSTLGGRRSHLGRSHETPRVVAGGTSDGTLCRMDERLRRTGATRQE